LRGYKDGSGGGRKQVGGGWNDSVDVVYNSNADANPS